MHLDAMQVILYNWQLRWHCVCVFWKVVLSFFRGWDLCGEWRQVGGNKL